jgi:TRAP-type mannitol/chloroaromatic compound transport system permease small subunit
MKALLALARAIDWLTHKVGWIAAVAVIASCFISAGNAIIRFLFSNSSNAWLEIQWYLFAVCVMLGAAHVLKVNEHVRVDVFYGRLTGRGKVFVDLFGLVVFLMPVMGLMLWLSWPYFLGMYHSGEVSGNAGGLIRWPVVLTLPLGFGLVLLQGLSEIIKRVGWLMHAYEMDTHYERPLQ